MQKEFVEPVSIRTLETGLLGGDLTKDLYKTWLHASGVLNNDFIPHIPFLIQLAPHAETGDVPKILRVGQRSLMKENFGDEWLHETEQKTNEAYSDIDENFRGFVAQGYHDLIKTREPVLDVISAKCQLPGSGRTIWEKYTRLLLPIELNMGYWMIICAAERFDRVGSFAQQDQSTPLYHFLQTKQLPVSQPAAPPIAAR